MERDSRHNRKYLIVNNDGISRNAWTNFIIKKRKKYSIVETNEFMTHNIMFDILFVVMFSREAVFTKDEDIGSE